MSSKISTGYDTQAIEKSRMEPTVSVVKDAVVSYEKASASNGPIPEENN